MRLWWTSLQVGGKATWKTARSAASQTFSPSAGIPRWENSSLPVSWKARAWDGRDGVRNKAWELGSTPSVTYNRLFLKQDLIFSSEGVPILPRHVREPSLPVSKEPSLCCRFFFGCAGSLALLLFCGSSLIAWAQQDVIQQIRVIGNRRIPRETVLARLFTHAGDTYDPATIERDFNSLWNTGYFEDLKIAREDTPKGIILDIIVREKPTIREINYKGLNSVSTSDVLDRFKKEHVQPLGGEPL